MTRPVNRELWRHAERIQSERPIGSAPRPTLRPWAVVAYWLAVAFLTLACIGTFGKGW